MGFPTKVQLIKRQKSEQWYINFPSAVAQAMEFVRGEVVEWIVEDKGQLVLRRREVFRGFDSQPDLNTKPPKIETHAAAAVIYAQR